MGEPELREHPPQEHGEGSSAAGWRRQREWAARNETRILEAARSLLRSADAPSVEMRDIAKAAGVGVGTLYRRFGDKAGLLAAVVGEQERDLQEAMLGGRPPLGPGAPAGERLVAFLDALVSLTERNLGVLLATDATPPGRLAIGAYAGWHLHIVALLRELRPDLDAMDASWWADLLLAPLDPQLYARQRCDLRLTERRLASHLQTLARQVAAATSRPGQ
jgi:AcrR family transcriptional regulator